MTTMADLDHNRRFPVQSHTIEGRDFERPWRDVESEHDLHSATVWCLHLRVEEPEDVQPMADKLLRSGAEILNGKYIGGDSFRQWAEVYIPGDPVDGDGVALHMYFEAPTVSSARIRGGALARIAYGDIGQQNLRYKCTVSTAADWAEQAEII